MPEDVCSSRTGALMVPFMHAGHLSHRLFGFLEIVDQGLLGLSEVGVIIFT